jgi:hypothetical protein
MMPPTLVTPPLELKKLDERFKHRMSSGRRNTENKQRFSAKVCWNGIACYVRLEEDWSTMLGRLNAALNQTGSMDQTIEDLMDICLPTHRAPRMPKMFHFSLDAARNSQRGNGARSRWH